MEQNMDYGRISENSNEFIEAIPLITNTPPVSSMPPSNIHRLSCSSSSSKGNENTVSGMHLREWLESDYCLSASKNERLQVFKKIVQVVHDYHSQGIGLMDLKPSSFIMIFKTGDVMYMGFKVNTGEQSWSDDNTKSFVIKGNRDSICNNDQPEERWYALPEGLEIRDLCSANIYSLGLLMFECLYNFDSIEERSTTMLDLHQRIFPAQFFSECHKEAGFCSWLLHPEASSRPTTWRILHSDVWINDSSNCDIVDDVESEVMLHFLASSTENTTPSVDFDIGIRKLVVCGTLLTSTADHTPLNSSNGVCSISIDCDQQYIATAGRVSRKIKIYDQFDSLLDLQEDSSEHLVVDHNPILEISNESRLTCICWNKFVKSYLASTDEHGLVQVWDTNTGQGVAKYNNEHQQTTWSVDFSQVDPTKFATGGNDRSIKIWNINERNSICTIRSFDNVSCVQFSPISSHIVAFGCKDSNLYCYDIRKTKQPCFTLCGHEKAVCCVEFLDSQNLVSASIDNTLKLWDLKKTTLNEMSSKACILTYRGHTNVKNFIGLSVLDGYIACGSETNEVYAYDKSLPMPIARRELEYVDPSSEEEKTNRKNVSVTSVCWRKKSQMLVAGNSNGTVKILRMV